MTRKNSQVGKTYFGDGFFETDAMDAESRNVERPSLTSLRRDQKATNSAAGEQESKSTPPWLPLPSKSVLVVRDTQVLQGLNLKPIEPDILEIDGQIDPRSIHVSE